MARLQSWEKVPEQAFAHVERLLSGYNEHTTCVFKHILLCGRLPSYEDGWVPVPARLMQRKKPDADLKPLVEVGLLEMKPYDRSAGRCREWRVPDPIQAAYDRITRRNLDAAKVNLFDGRPTEIIHKSRLWDENNNRLPELICGALKQLRYGRFNRPAVEAHLASLKTVVRYKRYQELKVARARGKRSEAYRRARAKRKKAQSRFTTDLKCFEALLNQRPTQIGDGIYRYRLAYRPQMSGRLTQYGGGAQSCSSRMKAALYAGIEDLHNYDIKSSQVMIAIDLLEKDGFDASWLREYAQTNRAKYVYAERAGLPVAIWKSCLYALLMGATLPKGDIAKSRGSIRKEIEKVAGSLEETYERLKGVLAPLYEVLEEWHEYLREEVGR